MKIQVDCLDIAKRFLDIKEMSGVQDNPIIMAMLKLDNTWPENDEVPWCSAFVNFICFLLGLPRSKSLAAISWKEIGQEVSLRDAVPGFDICIFSRTGGNHVAFFVKENENTIYVLGGNQSNSVTMAEYKKDNLLCVRRLLQDC